MRIAVLGSPQSWYFHDLRRAAAGRHGVVSCAFGQVAARVGLAEHRTSNIEHPTSNASATDSGRSTLDVERWTLDVQDSRHQQPGCSAAAGLLGDSFTSGESRLTDFDCLLVRTMPPGSLEQVVFRMDALARLEAAGVPVVNPPKAIEVAVDKYLASAKLAAAGLRIPRTAVCQTPEDAMAAFAELGGDVVVKPLFGSEGRGITRLNDEALALRAFQLLADLRAVIYLQEFIQHEGFDYRVLLIGERALAMRRRNPLDWRTNVARGAKAEPCELTHDLRELALRAATAAGAPLAGVDLLPGRDGHLYAIEVNAVPGWRALAKALHVDVAAMVLEYLENVTTDAPPAN